VAPASIRDSVDSSAHSVASTAPDQHDRVVEFRSRLATRHQCFLTRGVSEVVVCSPDRVPTRVNCGTLRPRLVPQPFQPVLTLGRFDQSKIHRGRDGTFSPPPQSLAAVVPQFSRTKNQDEADTSSGVASIAHLYVASPTHRRAGVLRQRALSWRHPATLKAGRCPWNGLAAKNGCAYGIDACHRPQQEDFQSQRPPTASAPALVEPWREAHNEGEQAPMLHAPRVRAPAFRHTYANSIRLKIPRVPGPLRQRDRAPQRAGACKQ